MSAFEGISIGWRYRTIFSEHVSIIYPPSDFVQTASLNDLQLIFLEPVLYSGLQRISDHQESITMRAHCAITYRACAHSGLPIKWRCILYPWKIDEELIEKMAKAGCVEVSFGFESGSKAILQSMNKRFQPGEVRRISEMLKKHAIARMAFLLLGGPGENRETVEESLAFADSLDLESVKVTTGIRIYPDTTLARIALSEGVIAPHQNLLFPAFYLARGLQPWLSETINHWLDQRPHWHGGYYADSAEHRPDRAATLAQRESNGEEIEEAGERGKSVAPRRP